MRTFREVKDELAALFMGAGDGATMAQTFDPDDEHYADFSFADFGRFIAMVAEDDPTSVIPCGRKFVELIKEYLVCTFNGGSETEFESYEDIEEAWIDAIGQSPLDTIGIHVTPTIQVIDFDKE